MPEKIRIEPGSVQETLLLPLWSRAAEGRRPRPLFVDRKAIEIVECLDYDFSALEENIRPLSRLAWVARSRQIDRAVSAFLSRHPTGTVVNLGCGLDTVFERNDNGRMRCFELDLPDVITLRRKFFADTGRRTMLSGSCLETDWFDRLEGSVDPSGPLDPQALLFIAAGVLYFFEESEVQVFFSSLADAFPGGEIFFDAASPRGVELSNERLAAASGREGAAKLQWGLVRPRDLEGWDDRLEVVRVVPMFRGCKAGRPLPEVFAMWAAEVLRIMPMVLVRIRAAE